MEEDYHILELFSGIGGMHYAFKHARLLGHVITAVDINTNANKVYKHNFPKVLVLNKNIESLTPQLVRKFKVNVILMSPPCQPFTRVGNQRDIDDSRTDALKHICDLLKDLDRVKFILMENVKGFENSEARNMYTDALKEAGFHYREFMLSPSQFDVPNTRHRYYCLARRRQFDFEGDILHNSIPTQFCISRFSFNLNDILEPNEFTKEFTLPADILSKRIWLLDIVTSESTNTNCFTKAYTRYSEGTGSVFTPLTKDEITSKLEKLKSTDTDTKEYNTMLNDLKLRYFTPREIARLMCFPEEFQFSKDTTTKQKYQLLGNSLNIHVVGELLKILFS